VTAAEHYLADAVNGDAFQSLRDLVETNRKALSLEDDDAGNGREQDMLVKLANRSDPASQDFVLGQLEDLVSAIAAKKHFLRNLRNREEDVAVRRSQSAPPPANYQAFLSLVATVYRSLPPDSAQYLWDNSTFTSAILDSRGGSPSPALWDMLSAISSGPTAASKAYERIKDTRFSWNLLFKFYQHYLDIMPRLFEPIKTTRRVSMDPMSSNEIEMCRGWTNVLATVVRSSPLARSALLQAKPHPLQMLFEYVNCDIPLDLKAIIFGAITAFCTRIGDAADDDVLSKAVEIYERISFADAGVDTRHLDASRAPPPTGWMAKMEYAEQDVNTYPLTRAYIQFLTGLLPVTTSASGTPLAPRIRLTIALHRGTSYVLDRVLLVSNSRRYAREGERWEMFACIVTFLERALLGFHMDELLSQANSRAIGQIASSLAEEAGFTILLRLLSERPIFTFLAGIVDQASAAPSPRPPLINDVLLRSLRVYHRVLDIQLIFSDVLLLTLSDPTRNVAIVFRQPLGLQSLDQYLLVHLSNVNAIALLVGDDDFSISLVSTKVMSALAASPIFSRSDVFRGEYSTSVNRLAGIIDASDDSLRIAQGFCNRLDGGGNDLGPDRLTAVESAVLSGDIKASDIEALPLVVRSAILDLLIDSTLRDVPGPNIAHFLLGFEFKGNDFGLQDPQSTDSRLSCLQVVLDQLSQGAGGHEYSTVKLVSSHPVLAAKTARLIYQLFSHPFTGQSAMSYAISVAGFSARQLASLPRQCPAMNEDTSTGLGIASHYDIDIATSADILVAFLDYQRWILSSSALETFAFDGHGASASQVTASLFQASTEDADVGEDDSLGQRPPLIVDLLSSIDVEWQEEALDDMTASRPLDFYGNFDFDKYKRADAEWWDLDALGRGLRAFRRQLERQGAISAVASAKAIDIEAEYIIKRLGATNRATDISLAKGSFLTAWNQALKVSLAMLFQHVSEDQQEVVLFELLDALLDRFDGDQPPGVLEIICESVLVAITSLVNVLMEFDGVYLPVERLTITLRKIIDAIVRPGTTENARGTLYAATTQYIQLLAVSSSRPDDASFIASTIGREPVIQSATPGLHRATIKAIEAKKDRFMLALCRDAMDDRDVWKTECFTLLSGIAAICQSERDRQILSPLTKDGFLPAFVRSIKDREIALQECLSPDSREFIRPIVLPRSDRYQRNYTPIGSMRPRLPFSCRLQLLAEVLKNSSTLASSRCSPRAALYPFNRWRPNQWVSPPSGSRTTDLDNADEFASAEVVQRQHRVLICALQLIARTLASLRKSPRSGAGHVSGI